MQKNIKVTIFQINLLYYYFTILISGMELVKCFLVQVTDRNVGNKKSEFSQADSLDPLVSLFQREGLLTERFSVFCYASLIL